MIKYKLGNKTKLKGWAVLKNTKGSWKVIAHSETRKRALTGIKAKQAGRSFNRW